MTVIGIKASMKVNPAYWYEKFAMLPLSAKLAVASMLSLMIYTAVAYSEALKEVYEEGTQ